MIVVEQINRLLENLPHPVNIKIYRNNIDWEKDENSVSSKWSNSTTLEFGLRIILHI